MRNNGRLRLNGIVPRSELDELARRIERATRQFSTRNGNRLIQRRGRVVMFGGNGGMRHLRGNGNELARRLHTQATAVHRRMKQRANG